MKENPSNTTVYNYDNYHCLYECEMCGLHWQLNNEDGLVANNFFHCPKCGRLIEWVEDLEDGITEEVYFAYIEMLQAKRGQY